MPEKLKILIEKLESGFFGFWVKKAKVSFLVIFLIIAYGLFSVVSIGKDVSPALELGIINVSTVYVGVNPQDIDSLITEKIEREVKDIEGIKKITSTSSLSVSNVKIELENGVDVQKALNEIKDGVDKAKLPNDAEDPVVTNIDSTDNTLFTVMLYAPEDSLSKTYLLEKATVIKNNLEGLPGINKVNITGGEDYEIRVLLNKEKLESLGLGVGQVSQIIANYNRNTPIGNFAIKDLQYDYRFDGEIKEISELLNFPITSSFGSIVYLRDIAQIKKTYDNESIVKGGFYNNKGYNAQLFTVEKSTSDQIFKASKQAKTEIAEELEKGEYKGISYKYAYDSSETITDDYKDLLTNMLSTFLLVFLTLFLFIGLKEGFLATLIIPLAYLITFSVLYIMGFSLNFLTNFSLILSLGVAIDTIIVIIEGANNNLRIGHSPTTAVLFAVRDFKAALISGTMTTLAAFLPLMTLPGVMGKYLGYIPITIFITLLASLFLSLTVTQAIFIKLSKGVKTFRRNEKEESIMSADEKQLLEIERQGKAEKKGEHSSFRDRLFGGVLNGYYNTLSKIVGNKINRMLMIITPIILLILTFIFISPTLGFTLFPVSDTPILSVKLEAREGRKTDSMKYLIPELEKNIYDIPEIKNYQITANGNTVTANIELFKQEYREENGLQYSFGVEKEISERIEHFRKEGLKVETGAASKGPPGGKAVGINLVADSNKNFKDLITVSKDFEEFLRNVEGTKNVGTNASETPGQFVFKFNKGKLQDLGLTPNDIIGEIYSKTSGSNAGVLKGEYDDYDVKVKLANYDDDLSPFDIEGMTIDTKVGKITVGEVASYEFESAISSITRKDTKINITVDADVVDGLVGSDIQPILNKFAENYNFPKGTKYEAGGETAENADLIISTISAFLIAVFIIFTILVLQFNSYTQPMVILYSVVLALLGVNLGLFLMGLPYSMAFAIGFIALTGIVINNAIIFIDKINANLKEGLVGLDAVVNAGKSRLTPMVATTVTTILGILPISFQDNFWGGLGFTIIFGLVVGTVMTLYAIPSLYFELFLDEEDGIIKKLFKKLNRHKANMLNAKKVNMTEQ